MHRTHVSAALGLAVMVALVAACGRSDPADSSKNVILTGCLQPGQLPDTFQLAAMAAPSGPAGTRGTSQADGSANASGALPSSRTSDEGVSDTRLLTLVAGSNVDLARYQGTVVRITGQIEKQNGDGPTGTSGTRRAPRGDGGGAAAANPTTGEGPQSSVYGPAPNRPKQMVRVSEVQRIAESCAAR